MSDYVFVSYSRADRAYVDKLAQHLRGAGIGVWYDYDVEAGDEFAQKIEAAIDDCAAFLVVLTPESASSRWVRLELARAMRLGKPRLPLLLRLSAIPIEIDGVQLEDCTLERMPTSSFLTRLAELTGAPAPASLSPASSPGGPIPASFAPAESAAQRAPSRAEPGALLRTINVHPAGALAVVFSPDGRQMAVGGRDSISVFDTGSDHRLVEIAVGTEVVSIAWSPDSTRILAGARDRAQIWHSATGQPEIALPYPYPEVFVPSAAWSPDGSQVATAARGPWPVPLEVEPVSPGVPRKGFVAKNSGWDNRLSRYLGVETWDAVTGAPRLRLATFARAIAISPDGRLLAAAGLVEQPDKRQFKIPWMTAVDPSRSKVELWSLANGERLASIVLNAYVESVAFSPDGRTLATGGEKVMLLDARRLRVGRELSCDGASVAFSPNGRYLAAGGDHGASVWSLDKGKRRFTLGGQRGRVAGVAYSPDGQLLATSCTDGLVRFWQMG